MNILKNAYSLEAFPSMKVLTNFVPERGMSFSVPLNLTPQQCESLQLHLSSMMHGDIKDCRPPKSNLELTPLLEAIAEAFGYDAALLAEGKGETGKDGHSWTAYGHQKDLPLLILWEIEDATMLLSVSLAPHFEHVGINLIGDKQATAKWMNKAGAAIDNKFRRDEEHRKEVSVADGDVMIKIRSEELPRLSGDRVIICTDESGNLNDLRKTEVVRLMHSVAIQLVKPSEPWPDECLHRAKPGDAVVIRADNLNCRLVWQADEPIPGVVIQDYQTDSAHRGMHQIQLALQQAFFSRPVLPYFEDRPLPSIEAMERKFALMQQVADLRVPSFPRMTVSELIKTMDGDELIGSRATLGMKGGDVCATNDLLREGFIAVTALNPREVGLTPINYSSEKKKGLNADFEVKAAWGGNENSTLIKKKVVNLTKPYFSSHKGLPVRVDKCLLVWRPHDTSALAFDFFGCQIKSRKPNLEHALMGCLIEKRAEFLSDIHVSDIRWTKIPKEES